MIAEQHVAFFRQRREGGVIGLESGSENDGGFLLHQAGELGFELDM